MKIVIVSHETLATHMLATAEAFLGAHDENYAFELRFGDSLEDLEEALRAVANKGDSSAQMLVLCDIMSGSPFNVASKVSYGNERMRVVYGMNLGMVMEAMSNRDDMDVEELARHVINLMPATYGVGPF